LSQIHIVTDSTADIPADMAAELHISIVPCQIRFGQTTYREGVDFTRQEYFDKLANSPVLPQTSQPALGDFVETYRRLLDREQSQGIVSIHVAGNFSGVLNGAWTAAQQVSDPSKIEVLDSGSVSMGMGWVAIEAARMARDGATRPEISQAVQALLPRSKTAAMIDTLENLYKGGRINQISAVLGTALQIKPLLNIQGGEVTVWGKVRTRSRALQRLLAEVRGWGPLVEMSVLHGGAEDLAHKLAESLQDLVPADRMRFQPAGSALVSHLGLGAVGVCALTANGEP
jgi:DegV family protein with EDD domain